MHLKSLTLKGFKSFPERTRLDFGPGVSVVVGPNGSGKSNVTDALLWAMGEQSPLAIRGQSMQDVIFGGGRGVQARSSAEVEIVLDNSDGTVDVPLSEISIVRRLERSGEGEYRLNGARCRLVDVIEVLSDTGLGKETHSIISQGRVEAIVMSKPRERRLLIEEAAGLGKHRKRRRRAQLKLERTQENLDRALDIEREARTRLRPLKRQAEAAELHERLERQSLEARLELAREAVRATRERLLDAEEGVRAARAAREQIDSRLRQIVERRTRAESALTERSERREEIVRRAYEARSGRERLQMRGEQAQAIAANLSRRASRIEDELRALEQADRDAAALHEQELARQGADAERVWSARWGEVRKVIVEGVGRALSLGEGRERERAIDELARQAERIARRAVEHAVRDQGAFERERERAEREQRRQAELEQRAQRTGLLRAQDAADGGIALRAQRLASALANVGEAMLGLLERTEQLLGKDRETGELLSAELRACAQEEAEIQSALRVEGEAVTGAEVAAQRLRDQAAEAEQELTTVCERLELPLAVGDAEPLQEDQEQALRARLERLARRREQLGPVNPLAGQEFAEALGHVEELEERRTDLEIALRELRGVIRETDRQIHETFNATFEAAARNFEELVGDVFPGGSGRLRLLSEEQAPQPVLGGQTVAANGTGESDAEGEAHAELEDDLEPDGEQMPGVEIEITPAGKSTKRLSLLSGGEKSMTALAFLFAVFLARPCPFYVLDEVEAALDDLNLDRFLTLLRRYADRAQFIVITHQKRTMEAADWLYGVSMAENGVSKVLSRRLPPEEPSPQPMPAPQVAPIA
ncbi:MAG TPA: AAA family ATPase [Solirubrobacteraceae bacterium]|nr:AAA family ATPase [Solirubrobacteraceae bacterium]